MTLARLLLWCGEHSSMVRCCCGTGARERCTMLRSEFEQAIGRAATDVQFRGRLLADPVDALLDYGLDAQQTQDIAGIRYESLSGLMEHILRLGAHWWGSAHRPVRPEPPV